MRLISKVVIVSRYEGLCMGIISTTPSANADTPSFSKGNLPSPLPSPKEREISVCFARLFSYYRTITLFHQSWMKIWVRLDVASRIPTGLLRKLAMTNGWLFSCKRYIPMECKIDSDWKLSLQIAPLHSVTTMDENMGMRLDVASYIPTGLLRKLAMTDWWLFSCSQSWMKICVAEDSDATGWNGM